MENKLDIIKQSLASNVGKKLMVKANSGRRRTTECEGVLAETYPSVFVVELDQEENTFDRVSYSYTDILTATVELRFWDEQEGKYA